MLGYDNLLTNSTYAGLKMCAGEFGQKMLETSEYDPRYKFPSNHNINPKQHLLGQSEGETQQHTD